MDKNIMSQAQLDGTDVILYGAGKYGRIALQNIKIRYPQMSVKYFVDDDLVRNRGDIDNISIVSLNEAIDNLGENILIIISNYYVNETLQKIERSGIDLSRVIFLNEILIETVDVSYIEKNKEKISRVYSFLEDYESKVIYKTMVESRFTHNIDVLARTCRNNQYFPDDIFQLGTDEIFVDGGAFDGDTISAFLQNVNNKFQYIYAFEPDTKNFDRLMQACNDKNIKLFKQGLYNENGKVSFSASMGGSSVIDACGYDEIEVCSLDTILRGGLRREVSFVKLDIEGSELNALQGMKNTIIKNEPKLAVCIYHKFEDIWEIPLFIKQLNPNYKLYIRNYTTYLDEIVLYAKVQ